MKLRFPLVLLAALAAFAIPASSAFASVATFVAPAAGSTISQDVTFSVDTTGDAGAAGVNFFVDDGTGMHTGMSIGSGSGNASGVYSLNAFGTTLANSDGSITIDANVVDSSGTTTLEQISQSFNYVFDAVGPSVSSTYPAADANVYGTFSFWVVATDRESFTGEYSTDNGTTWATLAPDGSGNLSAPINTLAAGIPNGDFYLTYRLTDSVGNTTEASVHYVVQNPQAPVITPGTLIADKSLFRTAETQLETGDAVEAYKMEATGFPAPAITYRFVMCDANQVCHDVAPTDPIVDTNTGLTMGYDYYIQASDLGMHLTVIATATNASGSDSTTTDFGVIAQGYVAPTVTPGTFTVVDNSGSSVVQSGDTLQVTNAPAYTGGYPTPTTNYTWVICHGNTCTTANGLTYVVQAGDYGADITIYADVYNSTGGDSASFDFGIVGGTPAPAPAPAPAPVVAPPVVAPPVVAPPVVPPVAPPVKPVVSNESTTVYAPGATAPRTVVTGSGNDHVTTGSGNDHVSTGAGADHVKTGAGNDIVNAGAGNDVINTGSGHDVVNAGAGNDKIVALGNHDVVNCGAGYDTVTANTTTKTKNCEKVIINVQVVRGQILAKTNLVAADKKQLADFQAQLIKASADVKTAKGKLLNEAKNAVTRLKGQVAAKKVDLATDQAALGNDQALLALALKK